MFDPAYKMVGVKWDVAWPCRCALGITGMSKEGNSDGCRTGEETNGWDQ